jgi:hypothetical protein
MNSDGYRMRTLPRAASLVALLKVVPETLNSSDRTKAGLRAALLNYAGKPFPPLDLLDFSHSSIERTFRFSHTRGKSWTACPPPPLVISS